MMERSHLKYATASGRDAFIYFDSVLSSSVIRESLVPEHEVESGTNTTDDTRAKPTVIRLEVFVSNTPLDDAPLGAYIEAYETSPLNRATQVETALADIQTRKVPVDLNLIVGRNPDQYGTTDYQTSVYSPYLVQSAETSQGADTGDGVKLTLSLKELLFATSQTVKVDPKLSSSAAAKVPAAKKDLGPQGPAGVKPMPPETRSTIKVGVDKAVATGNPTAVFGGIADAVKASLFGGW